MYVRRPLVQRTPQQRRVRRWSVASLNTTDAAAATGASDFDAYVQSECGSALFDVPSASGPSPTVHRLHSGSAVAALPPSHAVLNHTNSAVWLPVLTALHQRGALSSSDCASAIRFLPAFTFRPLLPWLWAPARTVAGCATRCGAEEGGTDSATGRRQRSADMRTPEERDEVAAEVYNNMSLVALELARRAPPMPTTPVSVPACTIADLSTAAPERWSAMARSLAAALVPTVPRPERLQLWHDILFTLRSHAVWDPTACQLRSVAHSHLLDVFSAFYADMRGHEKQGESTRGSDLARGTAVAAAATSALPATAPQVVTLAPPILLRKFRALYRQHRHSAMLFAELYASCVVHEEQSVGWRGGSTAEDIPQQPRVTALLMDVDLAVYYATLPGRRHCGLGTPADQWAATLHHLRFLLPRLLVMQRCQACLSLPAAVKDAWQPWRRVAAALMNVCVWVENNNREAERCCAALRATVDALRHLYSESASERTRIDAAVHSFHESPTTEEVSLFVTILMRAAADSMAAKALQLHYGPTDGLFGIQLLSVAVAAVLPQPQQPQHKFASHGAAWAEEKTRNATASTTGAATAITADDVLHRLHLLTFPTKSAPHLVWAALRRTPHVTTAARYGLVTTGYRIFSDCVVPQAGQTATAATARRLLDGLCDWASIVGRPLGLRGRQVYALWQLRWTQAQKKIDSHAAKDTAAVLQRLSTGRSSSSSSSSDAQRGLGWVCGCGFRNEGPGEGEGEKSVSSSCVSCVLRTLTPHAWECPSCHTVASSGVHVPYCLHCGEAHPSQPAAVRNASAAQHHRESHHAGVVTLLSDGVGWREKGAATSCCWDCGCDLNESTVCSSNAGKGCTTAVSAPDAEEEERRVDGAASNGLVYVCNSCESVTIKAPALAGPLSAAPADPPSCSTCSSHEGGYYTAAFTWTCGCGATNAALHNYCHVCSKAAQQPTMTCPQCRHTCADVAAARCAHCSFPHPRRLAAVEATRLVRCPACQGHVPSTSRRCQHCGSTTVSAVVALLPTVADQPWPCLRCGHHHDVRSAETGALLPPPHIQQRAGVSDVLLPPTVAALAADMKGSGGAIATASHPENCCTQCGTRRVAPSTWEAGRLWSCTACGEHYNTGAACRRCATLALGVPAAHVHVWRCGGCGSDHPSWERTCLTPGCRCSAQDSSAAVLCYSPWECPACGGVTLSSHAGCCASCGASTPADVSAASCTAASCAATRNTSSSLSETSAEERMEQESDRVASVLRQQQQQSTAAVDAPTRLAQVEAFLLQAAATDAPLHASVMDNEIVRKATVTSLWPAVGASTNQTGVAAGAPPVDLLALPDSGEEAWEDAYRAAVLSF